LAGLLDRGGFVDVDVDRVKLDFRVDDAAHWWHGLLAGTVRSTALVTRQPPDVRQGIRAASDRRTQPYPHAGRLPIPCPEGGERPGVTHDRPTTVVTRLQIVDNF
jgi:hypothetical protein